MALIAGINRSAAVGMAMLDSNITGDRAASRNVANTRWRQTRTAGRWSRDFTSSTDVHIPISFTAAYRVVKPSGIASAEAFGVPAIRLSVVEGGIASLEGFGIAVMLGGVQFITVGGIASLSAFGLAIVSGGAGGDDGFFIL